MSGGHSMPPLLSLAAIHDQVNKTSPNILAAHLNKPMMHPGKSISLSFVFIHLELIQSFNLVKSERNVSRFLALNLGSVSQ
jgi:hypothetical protein